MSTVIVTVHLKQEILDPQGAAVKGALARLGLTGIEDVRQGKQFRIKVTDAVDEAKLIEINNLAETLLSNPVIEDFTVEVVQ